MPLVFQGGSQNCNVSRSDHPITTTEDSPAPIASHRAAAAPLAQIDSGIVPEMGGEGQALVDVVVCPVHSLPPEIMSCVFIECLPNDSDARPSNGRAPLLLVRVCRRWTDIALSTPYLWSSLEITAQSRHLFSRSTLRGLETWFSRAHTLPLSLKIQHNVDRSQIVDISGLETLDISDLLPRVERLTVWFHMDDSRTLLPATSPLPQLRSLTAVLWDADLRHVIQNAPCLTELFWTRGVDHGTIAFHPFTSNTLTKLDICFDSFSGAEFIGILQHLPMLSYLACYVTARFTDTRAPLPFPNLHTLRLRQWGTRSPLLALPIDALGLVTLPNLRHLEYDSCWNSDVVTAFLSRSQCTIRQLKCQMMSVTHAVRGHLEPFLHVEELYAIVRGHLASFVDTLHPRDDSERSSPPMLLELRRMTISYLSNLSFDYSSVIDFVHRRRAAADAHNLNAPRIAKLESLYIKVDTGSNWRPDPTIENELHRLISSGVDFEIQAIGDDRVIWPRKRVVSNP
ncbi:F-box domain-containing protein [Mycena sanguinolenta]|uniref:F-box domain-containing protein n=1 Tax=Mycena sanguinolenta TaxID=230812 RepID=A0A8H7CZ68_9AGAR|nr:F-box domain-containing protein [Mycena sanguinolenta]KAF7353577.1 F-box domain-containing protein [Mycena sanguinolenta]